MSTKSLTGQYDFIAHGLSSLHASVSFVVPCLSKASSNLQMVFLQLKYSCLSLCFCDLGSLAANSFVFYELRIGLPEDYFTLCLQRDSMDSVVDVIS
jgi:hypothetical protein